MRTNMLRWLAPIVGVTVLASACGAGPKPASPTPVESTPQHQVDALARSSTAAAQASTFHGTFHIDLGIDGHVITEDGVMSFRAPASSYGNVTLADQTVEVRGEGSVTYVHVPGQGWFTADSGINRDAYDQYVQNRGAVDYPGTVGLLDHTQQLSDQEIDGTSYAHYTGALDFAKIAKSLPGDIFKPGVVDEIEQSVQPANVDVWLDKTTGLPRRLVMQMRVHAAGRDVSMTITTDYTVWDQPVDIPAVPSNARPISELSNVP